eukprot:6210785-Pleurochrysis_carterae.AAC.9
MCACVCNAPYAATRTKSGQTQTERTERMRPDGQGSSRMRRAPLRAKAAPWQPNLGISQSMLSATQSWAAPRVRALAAPRPGRCCRAGVGRTQTRLRASSAPPRLRDARHAQPRGAPHSLMLRGSAAAWATLRGCPAAWTTRARGAAASELSLPRLADTDGFGAHGDGACALALLRRSAPRTAHATDVFTQISSSLCLSANL